MASAANLEIDASGLRDDLPDGLLDNTATLLIQLEIPLEQNRIAIADAHDRGARVVLNAAPFSPVPQTMLRSVDVLVVNEIEAASLRRALPTANPDAHELDAARALSDHFDLICIVTLGANGAVAFAGGAAWQVGALEVEVLDSTGAGDAFVGTLAGALDVGAGLTEALRAAAVAGALACTKLGAQSGLPSRPEINEGLTRIGDVVPWEPDSK